MNARLLGIILFLFNTNLALGEQSAKDISFSGDCSQSESSAVLSFNGDILIHHFLYEYILPKKTFTPLWSKTSGLIKKADFSVGNLEGPTARNVNASGVSVRDVGWIYDANYYGDSPSKPDYDSKVVYSGTNFLFNFHPLLLSDLKRTGYDLLTLANNHSLDRKSIGIDRTLDEANAAMMPTSGVRRTTDNRVSDFYHIDIINDIMVAFISCTEMTNGNVEDRVNPNKKDGARFYQVLRCMRNQDEISDIIKSVAPSVDAVIVLPHWGDEYSETESSRQRSFGRKWIQDGALAVIGSHPHVLQPWEKFVDPKSSREGVIMYSLGNFVASQGKGEDREATKKKAGIVAYVGLSKTSTGTKISAVGYTPTRRVNYEAIPLNQMDKMITSIVVPNFGTQNFIRADASTLGARFCK